MFKKLLLSFFPEEEVNNKLSPIKFHLKLIAPKLFYWLTLKHTFVNRRAVCTDTKLEYFVPASVKTNVKDENFFYSYKSFALLNWYDNYSLFTILPAVMLIAFVRYFSYLPTDKFSNYMKALLFSINYVQILFFAHFKEYDVDLTKIERIKFMLKIIENIIYELEIREGAKPGDGKVASHISKQVINILKKDYDFVLFLYNTTEHLANIFGNKWIVIIDLYDYFVSAELLDLPDIREIKETMDKTILWVHMMRYSSVISPDIISFSNIVSGEFIHINYLSPTSIDFFPYLAENLDYIFDIDLKNENFSEIIDEIYNFDKLWKAIIKSLREFNSDYIDITVSQDMNFQEVKELLSKEAIESVKKVSLINEQFIDFFILFIVRKHLVDWDNYQWEIKGFDKKLAKYSFSQIMETKEQTRIKNEYFFLDRNYYQQAYLYRKKKRLENPRKIYDFYHNVAAKLIPDEQKKILLQDFTKKSLVHTIDTNNYNLIFRKSFEENIKELIKPDGYKKYIRKFSFLKNFLFNDKQIANFKRNIYFPDFMVFYEFLKNYKGTFAYKDIITVSFLKQSFLGYLIASKLVQDSWKLEKLWKSAIFVYDYNEKIDNIIDQLQFDEFVNFFTQVKQNKEFVKIMEEIIDKLPEKHKKWFILDCMKDITLYNKRFIKL